MASVEKPISQRASPSNAFSYSRLLQKPGGLNVKILASNFEVPSAAARPSSIFGTQKNGSSKKTPPPVPPRTAKTYAVSPSASAGNIGVSPTNSTPKVVESPVTETPAARKKTPPPVPKKPVHLQLSASNRQPTLPWSKDKENSSPGQNSPMRLFALLLSPSTPSPIAETVISNGNCDSTPTEIQAKHSSALFGSTPHLAKMVKDSNNALVDNPANFDANNNLDMLENSNEDNQVDNKNQRVEPRSLSKSARRKSLPLLGRNSRATTPTKTEIYHSDGRSAATSHCSSSFGAEHGSWSSLSSSSPPPPIPMKDYCQNDNMESCKIPTPADGGDSESVVFFSTVSTVSSCQISRDCSMDGKSVEKQDVDSAKANRKLSSRLFDRFRGCRPSNSLLNEFLLEQNRRNVSVIERNARIIKWLYNCSKS